LKPIGYEDFLKAVNKVKARIQSVSETDDKMSTSNDSLFVKSDYKLIRINLTDIKYIESANEYVQIHIEDEKPITTLIRLKNMEEQLPKSRFMRVHRSFIVNLDKVKVIDRNRIVFDKVYIPVGDQYKDAFQAFIDKTFLV
jgi:two-component system LytT family response regulator